ncbi:MAG: hypothetical protein H5T72_02850 [Actinobacteria bacterium]|nr:hypothetical protein [Actinomycetota bacterium]
MHREEILRIMNRIARDFSPLLPGLRLEVIPPEGFRARMRGKPIIADERTLRAVLMEEAPRNNVAGRPPGRVFPGGPKRCEKASSKVEAAESVKRHAKPLAEKDPSFTGPPSGVPEEDRGSNAGRGKPGGEGRKREQAREETAWKDAAPKYPLYALPASRTIMVEMESLAERINREDRRLHRPMVEGLVLREILYLITSGQPLPEPRARAERILRRHWPFQYAALRSVGLTITGFERLREGAEQARDN